MRARPTHTATPQARLPPSVMEQGHEKHAGHRARRQSAACYAGIAWLAWLRWPSMSRTCASCRTTLSFRVITVSLLDPTPEDMDTVAVSPAEVIVTAENGVRWRRLPGSTSSAEEFLAVLAGLGGNRVAREWSLWREGEPRREDDRRHEVLFQWEHADPPPGPYLTEEELEARFEARWAETKREREARAAEYDHDRAMARLKLLSAQADAGFMRHVLENPASDAQRDMATEFLAVAGQEIKALEAQVGDPDAIPDKHGDLPEARRGYNLDSHMRLFRHETLRAWSKEQRPRFRQLLAMPVPQPADMCAECQAPADWHTYGVSLRLFLAKPEPGSQAETIARLMPGWWERCPASTSIQIRQQWGQGLPDFDGSQWQAMLTPLLRAIFAPDPPRKREKPDQRAILERRLRSAEAEASRIRGELAELGPGTGGGKRQ